MADGRIKMTVTKVYDVDFKYYNDCLDIKDAVMIDSDNGCDAMFSLLEDGEYDLKFEAVASDEKENK